jgi:glucose-1-phosphate cytidylyltransferase
MNENAHVPIFILAGGLGTRISEETHLRPKPMIEIGDIPILVHIMRRYYAFGFNDFIICGGYRSWEVKNYFLTYQFRVNHLVIDHRESLPSPPQPFGANGDQERWRVRVIDTGEHTMTGGRLARAFDAVAGEGAIEDFGVTYGDGVADVDLTRELLFHREHGKTGTVLAVRPMARFGDLDVRDGVVRNFCEKPEGTAQGLINGGFLFFKARFRDYLSTSETCVLEREPVSTIAQQGELRAFAHEGFWHPMDTQRDKAYLEEQWASRKAPWLKVNGNFA